MLENDALQGQMLQTEKDTIDVITFLKKEDAVKDQHVNLQALIFFLIILMGLYENHSSGFLSRSKD